MSLPSISELFLSFALVLRPKPPFSQSFCSGTNHRAGRGVEKSFLVWGTWAFVVSFPLPLHAPNHVTRKGRNFVNGAERWLQGRDKLRPFPEAANLLAERCGVSNKQQWAGNIRYVIGWGENLAGAYPEAPPPLGYPGYPSGSGRWEGLWKLLLTLQRLVFPGNAGRRDTRAIGSSPDCTLWMYPSASLFRLENQAVPGTPSWPRLKCSSRPKCLYVLAFAGATWIN